MKSVRLICVLALAISVAACGGDGGNDNGGTGGTPDAGMDAAADATTDAAADATTDAAADATTDAAADGGGGAVDQCLGTTDVAALCATDPTGAAVMAAIPCTSDTSEPTFSTCIAGGFATSVGTSVECSSCYGASGACGFDKCAVQCVCLIATCTMEQEATCLACLETNCTTALETCAGAVTCP